MSSGLEMSEALLGQLSKWIYGSEALERGCKCGQKVEIEATGVSEGA